MPIHVDGVLLHAVSGTELCHVAPMQYSSLSNQRNKHLQCMLIEASSSVAQATGILTRHQFYSIIKLVWSSLKGGYPSGVSRSVRG